jgi:hypothetical protein
MTPLTPYLAYIKIGAAAVLLAIAAGGGFHFGGLSGSVKAADAQTALEGLEAAQAENTAKAVLAERASAAAESARVNTKLKEFEDAPIDPVVTGLAARLYAYAASATDPAVGPVPTSSGSAGATVKACGVPRRDPEAERLSQDAFDAGGRDAERLNLCRDVWPRR